MGSAMDQRLVLKSFDPLRYVAFLAILFGHLAFYCRRIRCPGMFGTRTMTYLAPSIFEMRSFLNADESSGLAVTCGVAWITLFDLVSSKMLHLFFDAVE